MDVKTIRNCGWLRWRASGVPGVPLKKHRPTGIYLLWASMLGWQLKRYQALKCLVSGWGSEGQLFPKKKCCQIHCFVCLFVFRQPPASLSKQYIWKSINLTSRLLGDSLRSCPTHCVDAPKPLLVAFSYKWPVWAHAVDFPKISQKFTNPKETVSGISMPILS